ncbi:MAG TPA: hypothetical protein VJA45_02145 [Methylomirabilota bacterium]|nr:hypothetical protein [Methylomirabilota bacterium]
MKLKVATVQMTTDDRDKARLVDKVLRMIDEGDAQGAHRHRAAQVLLAALPAPEDDGTGEPIPHRVPPLERAGFVSPVTTGA